MARRYTTGAAIDIDYPLWGFGLDTHSSSEERSYYDNSTGYVGEPIAFYNIPSATSEVEINLETETLKTNAGNTFRHTSRGFTFKMFELVYKSSPEEGVSLIKALISSGHIDKDDAIEWVFPIMISSKGETFDLLYQLLVQVKNPKKVLDFSVEKFRSGWGESYLQLAVSILNDLGKLSKNVLIDFVSNFQAESEFFIVTLLNAGFLSSIERTDLINRIMVNPFVGARIALIEYLKNSEHPDKITILKKMKSRDLDQEVKDYAEEALS